MIGRYIFAALAACAAVHLTVSAPLDDYVWAEDSHYKWVDLQQTMSGKSINDDATWTGYVLNMTSQKWLDETLTSQPVWWHIIVVIVPSTLRWEQNATLWITGGGNSGSGIPSSRDEDIILASELAMGVGQIVGALFQIPNQPIVFADDPLQKRRSEDAIIAYTWDHFLRNTNDYEWLVRFPMVKASIRAMDAITDFSYNKFGYDIQHYVAAGASKRGWTTWLVGAVDPERVVAISPIVLDAINFVNVEHHQFRSYGGWSYALEDYYSMNITSRFDSAEMLLLSQAEDPYFFKDRLTMPKFVINAVGDEFQQPDDTWYWWNEMPEPKHFLLIPNAEHSLATGIFEALPAVGSWIEYLLERRTIPSVTWSISKMNGDITLEWEGEGKVSQATMWSAQTCNNNRRDFRLINIDDPCRCGIGADGYCLNLKVLWRKTELTETAPKQYVASFKPARLLWGAFLIDVTFESDSPQLSQTRLYNWPVNKPGQLEFTSEVSVWPNTFPFADCHDEGCYGTLV